MQIVAFIVLIMAGAIIQTSQNASIKQPRPRPKFEHKMKPGMKYCPAPEFRTGQGIDLLNPDWHARKTASRAVIRCRQLYPSSPCLKYIYVSKNRSYRLICERRDIWGFQKP